ncbi:protein S100-A12-like [Chelonoidis abingdonii]|uniref:protein S100-A12-like n=1 Tax=Chelonoidis abingdonii TaxID=106734 RepID=UPI0013F1AE34|nr:cornulin-like [Chelonoidis abingdonii]
MTQLLSNIKGIINAFYVSTKTDGTCPTLSKGELRQLICQEFADVTVIPQGLQTIDKMLQLLDTDCDGRLDFNGFLVLVLQMATACYKEVSQGQRPGHSGSSASQGEADCGECTQEPLTPERDPSPHQAPELQISEQDRSPHQAPEPHTPEQNLSP